MALDLDKDMNVTKLPVDKDLRGWGTGGWFLVWKSMKYMGQSLANRSSGKPWLETHGRQGSAK